MAKDIKTFHPLQMAESLRVQNEAMNLLITKVRTLGVVSENIALPEPLPGLFEDLIEEADRCAALLWKD